MVSQPESLNKGLSCNSRLSQLVQENYPAGYIRFLDKLFYDLLRGGCKGIDTKVSEVSDLFRFQALASELELARYFVMKKWQVELLSRDVFQGRRAPDIYVVSGTKEYFVEVKSIQFDEEEYNFGTAIANILNSAGMSLMVVVKSSSRLSMPAYKYETKDQKELDAKNALVEFKSKLEGISITGKTNIRTAVADVELYPTKGDKSYLGISMTAVVISNHEEYLERIRYDVLQKSNKRTDWSGAELDKLYVVAIDDASIFFDPDWYNIALFGPSTEFYPPLPIPEPTIDAKIQHALDLGWKEYLTTMRILRNNRSVIEDHERGMFYSETALKNVTAIMVRNRNNNFYLLANPFAEDRINSPNIMTEMADCIIGWP
jgi:hypothetical protein